MLHQTIEIEANPIILPAKPKKFGGGWGERAKKFSSDEFYQLPSVAYAKNVDVSTYLFFSKRFHQKYDLLDY